MKKRGKIHLDFVVDKLTNSIQNTISGDSFQTEVGRFTIKDSKQTTKKNGWSFNWKPELDNDVNEVYKLSIVGNSEIIQGLLSIRKETDHIFMNLLENAPFNIGKNGTYEGVAGNLFAFACKLSIEMGFEGFVSFIAKTELIEHYKKMIFAKLLHGQTMMIEPLDAQRLINQYFKN